MQSSTPSTLTLLRVISFVYGALLFAVGLFLAVLWRITADSGMHSEAAAIILVPILGGMFAILGADGIGRKQEWARSCLIGVAAVSLIFVPFGTAYGIFAFIVLFGQETKKFMASGDEA